MRNSSLKYFFGWTVFLEPVVVFFYTWSFLKTLILEHADRYLGKLLELYRRVSIVAVPLVFTGFYVALCVAQAKSIYYLTEEQDNV